MIMIYSRDKKLRKRLQIMNAEMIRILKKSRFDVSSSKDTFLQDVFQMTAIALVSVINHYHINGLHIF